MAAYSTTNSGRDYKYYTHKIDSSTYRIEFFYNDTDTVYLADTVSVSASGVTGTTLSSWITSVDTTLSTLTSSSVTDVQLGGTSIVTNGVATIPIAGSSLGVVKQGTTSGKTYGVAIDSNGAMTVSVPWTDSETSISIANKSNTDTTDTVYAVTNLVESGTANHTITPTYTGLPTKNYIDTNFVPTSKLDTTGNGKIPTLNANGVLPDSYLPDTVLGQMKFGGIITSIASNITYTDAEGNTGLTLSPTYGSTAANVGTYFIANTSGTLPSAFTDKNGNTIELVTGDWLVALGDSSWGKVDNTDAVTSVGGQTGAVSLKTVNNNALVGSGNISVGTVTSVRVQAGTGLSSSTSTAQSATLNTTISIANGYHLLTSAEYTELLNKADADIHVTAISYSGLTSLTTTITNNDTSTVTGTIPAASPSSAGVVTNDAQTIGGAKTFNSLVTASNGLETSQVSAESVILTPTTGATNTNIVTYTNSGFSIDLAGGSATYNVSLPSATGTLALTSYVDNYFTNGQTTTTYWSAVKVTNGVVVSGGQMLVNASSLSDSVLNDLVTGGFALIG